MFRKVDAKIRKRYTFRSRVFFQILHLPSSLFLLKVTRHFHLPMSSYAVVFWLLIQNID
jgi:hypothetical protein